ncbi:unnamed protein product [Ixodes hexagonus]
MNGNLDGCLIVSCCEDSPEELVREIVNADLPEPTQVAEGTKAFPWSIETKYYTATIYLHSTSTSVSSYEDSAENIHGLIVLFNPGQKASLELAAKWIEKCSCEVVLLVCGRCPADAEAEGMSRQQVLEWCIDRGCELIETRPNEEDDEEDATGVKRIVEALHAHPWPNLQMKGESDARATQIVLTVILPLSATDSRRPGAQRELELFSEAMADGDDMSFEELFAKFQDMKVEADKLSGEDRKKFAEKVAVQFWRAFGGEEDEVCGLSSEDEAEK